MANNNVDDDGVSTDVIGNFNDDDDDDDDLGEKVYAETRTALEILRCPISSPCFICTPAIVLPLSEMGKWLCAFSTQPQDVILG